MLEKKVNAFFKVRFFYGLVLCCFDLLLHVNSPCQGGGSRMELSVAGGGTE